MHTIKSDGDIIEVFLSGKLAQQSLFDAQAELMLHPDYPVKNSLWIFDHDFECHFSCDGYTELINRIKLFCPVGTTRKKSALCTHTGVHFAMAQCFCEEAKYIHLPFKIRTFKDEQKARAWLAED